MHSSKEKKKIRLESYGGFYLKPKKYGPYIIVKSLSKKKKEIVKKIHNDVHVVDLPGGMSISKIFNIVDSKTSCSQWRGLM